MVEPGQWPAGSRVTVKCRGVAWEDGKGQRSRVKYIGLLRTSDSAVVGGSIVMATGSFMGSALRKVLRLSKKGLSCSRLRVTSEQ